MLLHPCGSDIRVLNIVLISISTCLIGIRVYVRGYMIKSPGMDDLFAVLAWVLFLSQSSLEIKEVSLASGMVQSDIIPSDLIEFLTLLPTMELLYIAGMAFVRLSVVAFLSRLNIERSHVWILRVLSFLIAATALFPFCAILFQCKNVSDLWHPSNIARDCGTVINETYLFWSYGATGILLDVALLAFPIWLICTCMRNSSARFRVLAVFSAGIFVLITDIVRFIVIVELEYSSDNGLYNFTTLSLWTDLESHVGLWVACFPAIQPLLRHFGDKVGIPCPFSSKKDNDLRQEISLGLEAGDQEAISFGSTGQSHRTVREHNIGNAVSKGGVSSGQRILSSNSSEKDLVGKSGVEVEMQSVSMAELNFCSSPVETLVEQTQKAHS